MLAIGLPGKVTADPDPPHPAAPSDRRACTGIEAILRLKAADPAIHGVAAAIHAPRWGLSCSVAQGRAAAMTPMTPDSAFRTASIGKLFTATVILQLVEQGRLGLDERASEILTLPYGSFATLQYVHGHPYGEEITVRQLLNHASGLMDYVFDDPRFARSVLRHPSKQWDARAILKAFYSMGLNKRGTAPPGMGFHYADTNYLILALVIEALTGQPFHTAVRDRIFDRVGMPHTYLEWHEPRRGQALLSHAYIGALDAASINTSYDWGGGGFVSTLTDLDRFLRALLHAELFTDVRTLPEMMASHAPGEVRQGLGLTAITIDGVAFYGHSGAWGSVAAYAPSADVSIEFTLNQAVSPGETAVLVDLAHLTLAAIPRQIPGSPSK